MTEEKKPMPADEAEEPMRVSSNARLTRVLFDGHVIWEPGFTVEEERRRIRKAMLTDD
jgi:hypothetical protein